MAQHLLDITAPEEAVQAFSERLRGEVLRPDAPDYDAARRVWNGMIDRRPALIARCAGTADVIAAVDFARTHGIELGVRGGGHDQNGDAVTDGGLTLDLSAMQGIRVDPARRTAQAQAGLTWGAFDHETQAFGLATTGGTTSTVGIAGLTLGGGQGWLMAKHGATVDNLRSVDIVTADGRLLTASEREHPDLFWAVRGGGGNFGVVTSFEYQLHPVGPIVLGGMLLHPFERAAEVLRAYREFTSELPDELTCYAALLTTPEGIAAAGVVPCYAGPLEAGERSIAPLRAIGSPLVDLIGPLPYVAQQTLFDATAPAGRRGYWKTQYLRELSDGAIEALVEGFARVPSPYSLILLVHQHGAIRRVPQGATAFCQRTSPYELEVIASWEEPAATQANITWARGVHDALRPWASGGVYVNHLAADERERIREAYGPNYERLAAIKAAYDPDNLFHRNQNIAPAARQRGDDRQKPAEKARDP